MITPNQIFDNGQILTLAIAKTLVGKKIHVTNSEYSANKPSVRTGTIKGFITEWGLAALETYSDINPNFKNRQEYWLSYMTHEQIEKQKNRLRLMADGSLYCGCILNSSFYDEPTFSGSDEDRPIFFIVADEN